MTLTHELKPEQPVSNHIFADFIIDREELEKNYNNFTSKVFSMRKHLNLEDKNLLLIYHKKKQKKHLSLIKSSKNRFCK